MGSTESKKRKEHLKRQIQDFNDRLQRALIASGQARKTFITLSDLWTTSRNDVITTLSLVADSLDVTHKSANIASLTGTSSCIAGGTAGIVSLLLTPFTGGVSLALAAGDLVGTVAGSATTLGASAVEAFMTKDLLEGAKKVLDTDSIYTKALSAAFRELILHDSDVITILSELQKGPLSDNIRHVLQFVTSTENANNELQAFKNGAAFLDHFLILVSGFYGEDGDFLTKLQKTDLLLKETPSFSNTVTGSTDFFQALKELSSLGPETLKRLGETAIQSSAAGSIQIALGTQIVAVGLGAIFFAIDLCNLLKIARDYDEGSQTDLAKNIRCTLDDLQKEKEHVYKISEFYKRQFDFQLL